MHRIVIDLYDHTSDEEAAEFAQDIIEQFSPAGRVRVERENQATPEPVVTFDTAPVIKPLHGTKDYEVTNVRNLAVAVEAVRRILPPDREILSGQGVVGDDVFNVFTKPRRNV